MDRRARLHLLYLLQACLLLAPACTHVAWDPQHPAPDGPPPPSPSAPAADDRVDVPRPRFSWHLPAGEDGALIDVCRDPACARPFIHAEATTSFTPAADLPSGMVYWRLRGRAGGTSGTRASAIRALAVDTSTMWSGRYVAVVVPASESAFGERLVPMLDRAVEQYVAYLGVAPPADKVPLYFYTTDAAYRNARAALGAPAAHEAGFTESPQSVWDRKHKLACHIRFGTRLAGDEAPATGDVEAVALHELAHAVAFQTIPLYTQLPAWWIEGMSDLLASNALASLWQVPLPHQPLLSSRLRALGRLERVPLAELLSLDEHAAQEGDAARLSMLYCESFALLHHLDSSADLERQRAFHALVRSVSNLARNASATAQLRSLVRDLDRFEPAWLAAMADEPVFPWLAQPGADLRVLPSEIAVGAWPAHLGMVYWAGSKPSETARLRAGDRVEVVADVHPGDEPQACVAVRTADATSYVFCANNRGRARLVRVGKPTTRVAVGAIEPGLFTPGARRRLSLELGAERWIARVDDRVALELPAPGVPAGWGVAADSGRSHFLGAHVTAGEARLRLANHESQR